MGGAASRLNLYKVGISPYYTDKTAANHIAEKGVRFVASTTTAPPPTAVTFGTYLWDKFKNAKCVDCHTFTDTSTVKRSGHAGRGGITNASTEAFVTNASNCSSCHSSSAGYADGWRAAPSSMKWTSGTSALEMCTRIRMHKSSADAMRQHLKMGIPNEDVLVKWSLGRMGVTHTEWNQKVEEWISAQMKCQ